MSLAKCPLCNSSEDQIMSIREWQTGARQRVFFCSGCFFGYLHPMISKDVLNYFYSKKYRKLFPGQAPLFGVYTNRFFEQRKFNELASIRLERIKSYKTKHDTVIDIGSGFGNFLSQFRENFPKAILHGIEPDRKNACLQVDPSFVTFHDDIKSFSGSNRADLVTCFHTLEHLPNVVETIRDVRACLNNKGLFVIEVPSIKHELTSRKNVHLAHVNYFSFYSLKNVLEKEGFEIIDCEPLPHEDLRNNIWIIAEKLSIKKETNSCIKLREDFSIEISLLKEKLEDKNSLYVDYLSKFIKNLIVSIFGAGVVGEIQRIKDSKSKKTNKIHLKL